MDIEAGIPRVALSRTVAVVRALPKGKVLTRDAIAKGAGMKPGTGSANNRVIAATKFGLAEKRSSGYAITDLGIRLRELRPSREDVMSAVRNVSAFAMVLDRMPSSSSYPPEAEIARLLREVGVSEDRVETAARVFDRSWSYRHSEEAEGRTKAIRAEGEPDAPRDASAPSLSSLVRDPSPSSSFVDHPMVQLIMEQVPPIGTAWSAEARSEWLDLLRSALPFTHSRPG